MTTCPCGSGNDLDTCCGPYHAGTALPPTAEATMRARYAAFVTGNVDFLETTLSPDEARDFNRAETEKWAKDSDWLGLEIISTEGGGETDAEGMVEFVAKFSLKGQTHAHREASQFRKTGGKWLYAGGKVGPETVRRSAPKLGRNDPCSCGSGKKFKKCCGA